MKLVRNGHSWSGGERNRFFLNGGEGKFHEMSHLAGLDQIEDGRGLALVDWDQDGRLDLWYRNRSAPRLRLMRNRHEGAGAIAIKLEGTTSNRDGIGAVVELLPVVDGKRLVRSMKAGDLFLSQSSKWLHFGLGEQGGYTQTSVIWPGGEKEIFQGIESKGGRYLLKQGEGKAVRQIPRRALSLSGKPLGGLPQENGSARIILPARVPFPILTFRDAKAQPKRVAADGQARLLVLWSGTCPHCQTSLEEIAQNAAALRSAGLEVLALSVDGLGGAAADLSPAYDLMDRSKFPFSWGLTDEPSARVIHEFQEALFDRTPAAAVPLAILLDPRHQALAIYRGDFSVPGILKDWGAIADLSEVQRYHYAPPMSGTWFTNPLPRREVRRLFPAPKR